MIGKTISHYKILEKLGQGGMGVVYKAEDRKLKRTIALKFLPPNLTRDEEAKNRFIHEAQAASSLDHPNICTIHEINETDDGQIFIAMACYEGESLKEKLEKGSLPVDAALDIAIQIARGLEKAHAKGIVHRDIKPANIFITEEGQVKIIDFGLAKLTGATLLTKEGTTLGTAAYMSPEQAQGTGVDQRTDIWSLGIILYEMLAGEPPFKGDYEQAVMYSIMNEDPEFITKIRNEVPKKLEQILGKALEKKSDKRFQSIKEMLRELQTARAELQSGKIKTRSSLLALGRKQRRFVYRILAMVLIMIIGLGIFLWQDQIAEATPVSIALLPLQSIAPDTEQEWFTEGITDALITNLARISGLRIISRSSVMKYKGTDKTASDIGRELGISYLIEGSVLRVGEQIKITTRLIDAARNDYLWAQDYQRDFKDILSLQSEVARTIAGHIQVKLTPYEQNLLSNKHEVNPQAYDAYLKGNFYLYKLTPQSLETALKYFELATELDPDYALGYAGIALARMGYAQMGYKPFSAVVEEGKHAAEKALEIDSTLAEVHYTLGIISAWGEWNWEQSVKSLEKAIQINPNLAEARAYYSHVLFILNRQKSEAMKQIEQALELDPFNSLYQALYAMDLMYVRRYDDVIKRLETVRRTDPYDPIALSTLRSAYHQKNMVKEALEIWRICFKVRSDDEAIEALNRGNALGGYPAALKNVAELMVERSKTEFVTPWQIATLYTRAGMQNEALDWFEKAYEAHDPNMPYLRVDPIFEKLRGDPRYIKLIEKMGLKI